MNVTSALLVHPCVPAGVHIASPTSVTIEQHTFHAHHVYTPNLLDALYVDCLQPLLSACLTGASCAFITLSNPLPAGSPSSSSRTSLITDSLTRLHKVLSAQGAQSNVSEYRIDSHSIHEVSIHNSIDHKSGVLYFVQINAEVRTDRATVTRLLEQMGTKGAVTSKRDCRVALFLHDLLSAVSRACLVVSISASAEASNVGESVRLCRTAMLARQISLRDGNGETLSILRYASASKEEKERPASKQESRPKKTRTASAAHSRSTSEADHVDLSQDEHEPALNESRNSHSTYGNDRRSEKQEFEAVYETIVKTSHSRTASNRESDLNASTDRYSNSDRGPEFETLYRSIVRSESQQQSSRKPSSSTAVSQLDQSNTMEHEDPISTSDVQNMAYVRQQHRNGPLTATDVRVRLTQPEDVLASEIAMYEAESVARNYHAVCRLLDKEKQLRLDAEQDKYAVMRDLEEIRAEFDTQLADARLEVIQWQSRCRMLQSASSTSSYVEVFKSYDEEIALLKKALEMEREGAATSPRGKGPGPGPVKEKESSREREKRLSLRVHALSKELDQAKSQLMQKTLSGAGEKGRIEGLELEVREREREISRLVAVNQELEEQLHMVKEQARLKEQSRQVGQVQKITDNAIVGRVQALRKRVGEARKKVLLVIGKNERAKGSLEEYDRVVEEALDEALEYAARWKEAVAAVHTVQTQLADSHSRGPSASSGGPSSSRLHSSRTGYHA